MKYQMIIALLFFLILQACSKHQSSGRIVTIEPHSFSNTLFYSGTIQPLKTVVVPSKAEGVVVDMPFQYGEAVKAGQWLFTLSSAKFLSDYKSALMQYIKAKSDFDNSQMQMTEANFLHQNQLISDDDFKMKKSTFYAAQLTLLQAKDTLENLLHQLGVNDAHLYHLTIADIDKINQAMHLQKNSEELPISSPAAGIILSPNKNEEENKKIMKGDLVKQGDVLAIIGDMTGLSVRIKVNELTVNQLKLGQKVKVTGIAFPDDTLEGEIKQVDRQGETAGGGMPAFSVQVIVPKLTEEQQKKIHVGMSAKIEMNIEEAPQIMVPIAAIKEKNGGSYVQLYDKKTGKYRDVAVRTGKTTVDSVVILSALKSGDNIVIPG